MTKRIGTPALNDDASWNMAKGVLVPAGTTESKAEVFKQSLMELVNQAETAHATRKERQEGR